MLTTREFQRRRGPLISSRRVREIPRGPSRREGKGRGQTWFKTHACLLSSGFYRRVYAFSASERTSSFRIAEDDDDDDEKKEDEEDCDVGSLCRGPRLFVYVSGGLMAPALRARRYLLLSFWSSRHQRPPRADFRVIEHLTFMEYLEISVSTAIERLLPSAILEIRCRAFYLPEYLDFVVAP